MFKAIARTFAAFKFEELKVAKLWRRTLGQDFFNEFATQTGSKLNERLETVLKEGSQTLGPAWKVFGNSILSELLKEVNDNPAMKERLLTEDLTQIVKEFIEASKSKEWTLATSLSEVADLRLPHTWYPNARAMKRCFYYHMGPTNSGKTHEALTRLKAAKSGVYCAPLRLLAGEIADKLNAEGIKCSMITGQERNIVKGATHVACTIEMVDLHTAYDCVVIDEVQMLEDLERGSSWTAAILGILSPEVHLTGDFRAAQIVERLLEDTGDELNIQSYSRLSPLNIVPPVEGLDNLRDGDCIISFSRKTCLQLMKLIHSKNPSSCSVIYGNLPPEARREQARKFNERDGVKYLVATDAIGLGLNYNIARIIFFEIEKSDGQVFRRLLPHEFKQIAGRAGRYNHSGQVTSTNAEDLMHLTSALNATNISYISKAAIFPSFEQLSEFKDKLEEKFGPQSYSDVLKKFHAIANLDSKYFLESIDDICKVHAHLTDLPLCTQDVYVFTKAPVKTRFFGCLKALRQFAKEYSEGDEVRLKVPSFSAKDNLEKLEVEYAVYDLYIWLSFKYAAFIDRDLAYTLVEQVSEQISQILATRRLTSLQRTRKRRGRA
jgi:ATP-dependent RNA helicase SUPV3L1/SUV3